MEYRDLSKIATKIRLTTLCKNAGVPYDTVWGRVYKNKTKTRHFDAGGYKNKIIAELKALCDEIQETIKD